MGNVVIGLDPSSKKVAMAIDVPGKKVSLRARILPTGNLSHACADAYLYVYRTVKRYVDEGHQVYLFIEDPVVGRGGVRSTLVQAKTHGAMVAGAYRAGAEVHTVNNSQWKKAVVGSGNAGKPQIKEWVRDNWQYAYLKAAGDQDLMDASCVLKHGMAVIDRLERLAIFQAGEMESEPKNKRPRSRRVG